MPRLLILLCIVLAGCGAAPATPTATMVPAGTTAPVAEVAATVAPTATTAPAATSTRPAATATTAPALTAVPTVVQTAAPAANPAADAQIEFAGQFQPGTLRVGQQLIIRLGIVNKSNRPISGIRVFSTGPWDTFSVISIAPAGEIEQEASGWQIRTGLVVAPGATEMIEIVASPNEPGNHRFSFQPHENETKRLKDTNNVDASIAGTIIVTS